MNKVNEVNVAVTPDSAPENTLPDWNECALRVGNLKYLKENDLESDDFHADAMLPNPIHDFIHEYDDADPHKSAWFMHRLERLIEFVKAEA